MCLFIFRSCVYICLQLFSNIVKAHVYLVLYNFAMSIASSSDWTLRLELWPEIHRDLINFGVPAEAWPRKPPRIYHVYNLRRRGAWVQVLLAVRRFDVPRPLPEWDRGHGVHIRWDDYPTVDAAWDFAKRVSGWP